MTLSILSVCHIVNEKSAMLGGYQQVVSVEKARFQIKDDIRKFAKKNKVLIAQQIVTPKEDGKGTLTNTYKKIGKGNLPLSLPEQTNKNILNNAPDSVLYIIVKGQATSDELVSFLNDLGNESVTENNDWTFTIVGALGYSLEILLSVLVILLAFFAIKLGEHIGNYKYSAVKRMAGKSKFSLSFSPILQEAYWIVITSVLSTVIALFYLKFFQHMTSWMYAEILIVTLSLASILLLVTSLIASCVAYLMLQNQPIQLLIKNKAPLRIMTVLLIIFQIFSLFISMYSLKGFIKRNDELNNLEKSAKILYKDRDLFGLSAFGMALPNSQSFQNFFVELLKDKQTILSFNNFDSQLKKKGGYYPSAYADENVLYVNSTFLDKNGIDIDKNLKTNIYHLKKGEYGVLIPKTEKSQFSDLTKAWRQEENLWTKDMSKPIQLKQFSGMYNAPKTIYAYPNLSNMQKSNQVYADSPILIVYSAETFKDTELFQAKFMNFIYAIHAKDANKITKLIKKCHLENNLGALTNDYMVNIKRISDTQVQKWALIISNCISLISSILLITLVTKLHLYQNRKKHALLRLSGLSQLTIHKRYLSIIFGILLVISLIAYVLSLPIPIVLLPIIFGLIIGLTFIFQLRLDISEQNSYLKGG